jgi:ribosomal protein S25
MTKEEKKIYNKQYRIDNKEYFKEYHKEYDKQYCIDNKEYFKEYHKEYHNNKYNTDHIYKLKNNISTSIARIIRLFILHKYDIHRNIFEILGCTSLEFKEHIEKQFEPWMNWNNYAQYNGEFKYGWNIDHIKPLSLATTEKKVIELNYYTNIRPLCCKINSYIKRNKTQNEVRIDKLKLISKL